MKAIRFHQHGGPEVLQLDDVDDPKPGNGQVLVRVYAAGVNPTDATGRRGGGAQAATFPATLGRDAAGVVEGIGSGVKNVKSGDKVIVRVSNAGYSELLLAKEEDIYPVPDGVGPIDAASIGITYSTAWDAVVNKADVQAGQTVLVQGASGGVGIAAVQIAKAMGAKVIGNASTGEKRAWVLAQGDHVHAIPGTTDIDHMADNFAASDKTVPAEVLDRAGQLINQQSVRGHRYPEVMRSTIDTEDYA